MRLCWDVCGRDGGAGADLAIDCWVRGRPLAHSVLSCSIEALRDLRVRAGAVEGLLCVPVLSLAERLGRNGRESFLVSPSREGVRDGGGPSLVSAVSATRALHDLARLRTRGTILSRLEGLGPGKLGSAWGCSETRVSSRCREPGRVLGFDIGSLGSGFSDKGRFPGVPGPGLLAKSLCRTDIGRDEALLVILTIEHYTRISRLVLRTSRIW